MFVWNTGFVHKLGQHNEDYIWRLAAVMQFLSCILVPEMLVNLCCQWRRGVYALQAVVLDGKLSQDEMHGFSREREVKV